VNKMTFNLKTYWKIAGVLFALLLFSFLTTKTVLAKGCSVNCLSVYSIELTNLGSSIRGIVKLVDETGAGGGARGSVVHAVWTRPDGSEFDQYANIGTRLRANFSLYTAGAPGKYKLTVVDATKAGYTFDTVNSSRLSKSISIGNVANQPPTAIFNVDILSGSAPLTVNFDSSDSLDADGVIVGYAWNFGDSNNSVEAYPSHTYNTIGSFTATLTVTDNMGATASQSTTITVTDTNAGCSINCMLVDNIGLRYKAKSGAIKGLVWIEDENNNAVQDAIVHAVWTLPDGSKVDQYNNIKNKLRAAFTIKAESTGIYTLTIVEVTKSGYSFDPANSNVLNATINITP